jgi:hypothetical protein
VPTCLGPALLAHTHHTLFQTPWDLDPHCFLYFVQEYVFRKEEVEFNGFREWFKMSVKISHYYDTTTF